MTQIKIIPETISTAAERMRSRVLSPVELTASCLERIGRLQLQLNAWITVAAESALGAARTAEKQIEGGDWKGPFHGIPVGPCPGQFQDRDLPDCNSRRLQT